MNVKDKILELNKQHTSNDCQIDDLLITIITRFQFFEPCQYMAEDDEWVNVTMISLEDENISQPISVKKSEITMLGIFNREDVDFNIPKPDQEALYQ